MLGPVQSVVHVWFKDIVGHAPPSLGDSSQRKRRGLQYIVFLPVCILKYSANRHVHQVEMYLIRGQDTD